MRSPIIRHVDQAGVRREGDLYETFTALSRGDIDHFTALRPHQSEIWHIFTVQVAVLAIENAGLEAAPTDAATWRRILHALTPQWPEGEPWQLVVESPGTPALLQPAVERSALKLRSETPDALDVIVAGRNHEIKREAIGDARDDDWLFALVTLQTSEGSMGAGTKAVSRINGGYAARVTMRLAPAGGASASFLRDVAVLMRTRRGAPARPNGPTLLWTQPWTDASKPHDALSLDPLYVEVCRRVRLVEEGGNIHAMRTSSPKAPLVISERGVAACPWTPIVIDPKDGDKAFNNGPVAGSRVPAQLLDRSRTRRPLLAEAHPEDREGAAILIKGLRREQGTTQRFDVHRLPLPAGEPATALQTIEATTVGDAETARGAWTALRTALTSARQGAPERIRFDDRPSSEWADEARAAWELRIASLTSEDPPPDAANGRRRYARIAREVFAARAAGLPGARMPRGIAIAARSGGLLDGMLTRYVRGDAPQDNATEEAQ